MVKEGRILMSYKFLMTIKEAKREGIYKDDEVDE